MSSSRSLCRCEHPRAVHDHYRAGSDCGICGADVCGSYATPRRWRRTTRPRPVLVSVAAPTYVHVPTPVAVSLVGAQTAAAMHTGTLIAASHPATRHLTLVR